MAALSDGDRDPTHGSTLRVLHVTQPTTAGVAVAVLDLVAAQAAAGWRVSVASPADPQFVARVEAAGGAHVVWSATREPGPGLGGEVLRLRRIVRQVDPSLLHLHSSKAGLAGRVRVRRRPPVIFEPHAWSFEAVTGARRALVLRWERLAARRTDAVLCVSHAERATGSAAGLRGRLEVVANGVDLERFAPVDTDGTLEARSALGVGGGPLVVCVGRLCEQKGQDTLIAAWPSVRARVPGAQLVLVGDGPGHQGLADAAGEGVRLVGHRDDAARWLCAADVVAMPSRWEGLPFVLLEAMAAGRCVVGSDIPPVREVLEDCGGLVPVDDAVALADAIVERLEDAAHARAEGGAARRRVEERHDLTQQVAAVLALSASVARDR